MDNLCTLYCNQPIENRLIELVNQQFNTPAIEVNENGENKIVTFSKKNGFLKGKTQVQISMRNRSADQDIYSDESPLAQNIRGIQGFIAQIPNVSTVGREALNISVEGFINETAILSNSKNSKELLEVVKQISQELDCVLFCQEGTFIGKGDYPHFLNGNLKLLVDIQGNSEVYPAAAPVVNTEDEPEEVELEPDQLLRKMQSIEFVSSLGIKTINHLPAVESETEVQIRSTTEISSRAVILAITNLVAFNTVSGEDAQGIISKYQLNQYVTPEENNFLQNPTDALKNQMSWKCEGIWTLCWALGIIDELGPANQMADLNTIPQEDYPIVSQVDPNTFIEKAHNIRSPKEILDATDLYYRLNWACVDARLNGNEMTAVHPGVVYERQYALNWLVNYMGQDWDDVSCDT